MCLYAVPDHVLMIRAGWTTSRFHHLQHGIWALKIITQASFKNLLEVVQNDSMFRDQMFCSFLWITTTSILACLHQYHFLHEWPIAQHCSLPNASNVAWGPHWRIGRLPRHMKCYCLGHLLEESHGALWWPCKVFPVSSHRVLFYSLIPGLPASASLHIQPELQVRSTGWNYRQRWAIMAFA